MLKNFSRLILWRVQIINRISMIKRTHSKGTSQHLPANVKEQLKDIENLQLTSENILEKLLNPAASEKKLANQPKKYDPKFAKKDYQTLVEENQALKQQLRAGREEATGLKFRLGEYERKVKFLEGIQEKWESSVEQNEQTKKQPVYTEILKKKIQELNELYLGAQEKIKELKQLPHISVFEESNIEKEYLLRETIRLKAVISASLPSQEQGGIENKFLKLIKQDNEKLKSTIRLHENDKNLLKSRQILQKRQINDYKREIEQLKIALAAKDTQIQTQANEYKNMIFKKAQQFSSEQKKKENQEFDALKKNYDNLLDAHRQLQAERDSLANEYEKLRKNERLNETKKNSEDKEKSDLRAENSRLRKILQELRDELDREREAARQIEHESRKKRREKKMPTNAPRVEQYPPVKFEDIELALMTLEHQLNNGVLHSLSDLFDEQELRCGKLVDIFAQQPLNLERTEATKLARYIVQGNSSRKVIYNEMATASKGLCLATLKAALSKLDECRAPASEDTWRCILARSKKLLPELQRMAGQIISKEAFLSILGRHINEPFGDYVTYSLLFAFDIESSDTEVMVSVQRVVELLTRILQHKTTR